MSEKKAPENKREKEKLIHVTEEQLQAGKAEIMKIVAGLHQLSGGQAALFSAFVQQVAMTFPLGHNS